MVFGSLFDKSHRKGKAGNKRKHKEIQQPNNSNNNTDSNNDSNKKPFKQKKKKRPRRTEETTTTTTTTKEKKQVRRDGSWHRPTEAALELSAKLKELSGQKRLEEALALYWDETHNAVRDSHHACILVNCAARCGAIHEGEKVVQKLQDTGVQINVETHTALLKGFAHAGMMHKGAALFWQICAQKGKRNRPNVRTLNTLLRGCLWNATSVVQTNASGDFRIAGGVVTSRQAWQQLCCQDNHNDSSSSSSFRPDSSSYEYFVAQLCYALCVDQAQDTVRQFQESFQVRENNNDASSSDPALLESLALCLLAMARGMAVLGQLEEARSMAKRAIAATTQASSSLASTASDTTQQGIKGAKGGKRSWRAPDAESTVQRALSNSRFRGHQLEEMRREANAIVELTKKARPPQHTGKKLAVLLLRRLLCFGGGGTTTLDNNNNNNKSDKSRGTPKNSAKKIKQHLINTAWFSFGLQAAIQARDAQLGERLAKADRLSKADCHAILQCVGLQDLDYIEGNGIIKFPHLFDDDDDDVQGKPTVGSSSTGRTRARTPIDIELGAGSGDWIIHQAHNKPERNFVSVELRADRVARTFAKMVLSNTTNLCCVGAESGLFLKERVKKGTVARIFVNHPEPPTQTLGNDNDLLSSIGSGAAEPAHMLSSHILDEAIACLEDGGKIVVVTDNLWYGRLLCATFTRVGQDKPFLRSQTLSSLGFRLVETVGRFDLYEGDPSPAIDHVPSGAGASYFDRLWRTGAGAHAERSKRFVLVALKDTSSSTTNAPTRGNQ